jgi:uncharacterized protein
MMKAPTLRIADNLSLPLDFITSTQAILAKKRVGKTYAAQVLAEELLAAGQQVVVIDLTSAWWGLRSSADGKSAGYPITIFGGKHGDLPLEPTAGEVLANAIVADKFSAVLDVRLLKKGQRLRFIADFLETLYDKNTDAMHLFLDEADAYCPQQTFSPEQARALGATDELVRRGGIGGIGVTLISQRAQTLNKNVLSQVDMLTVLRMNHPKDLKAIKDWIVEHVDADKAKEMMASLPALPKASAWVWAPELDLFKRIAVRQKRTYDSGRTPKVGEQIKAPKVLAKVDLERLGVTIKSTVEQAKANDPKVLKARVAELEKQLAKKGTPMPSKVVDHVIEKPVASKAMVVALERSIDRGDKAVATAATLADRAGEMMKKAAELIAASGLKIEAEISKLRKALATATAAPPIASSARRGRELGEAYGRALPKPTGDWNTKPAPKGDWNHAAGFELHQAKMNGHRLDGSLPKIQRVMLTALAERQDSGGLTLKKLRINTGYADSGPTSQAIRVLITNGWVHKERDNAGPETLCITPDGLKALGPFTPLPRGDDLREMLLNGSRLNTAERKMLAVICEAWPEPITRAEIRAQAGYADSGPTSQAMRKLVNLDFVFDAGREGLRADDALFTEAPQ